MKKHPFDSSGVMQWLTELYSATVTYQIMKQELILLCLRHWLISRLDLLEDHIAYITAFSANFKSKLAQERARLYHQSQITLDKNTDAKQSSTLSPDLVKVTEYESKKAQSDASDIPIRPDGNRHFKRQLDGHLIIRIYYRLL